MVRVLEAWEGGQVVAKTADLRKWTNRATVRIFAPTDSMGQDRSCADILPNDSPISRALVARPANDFGDEVTTAPKRRPSQRKIAAAPGLALTVPAKARPVEIAFGIEQTIPASPLSEAEIDGRLATIALNQPDGLSWKEIKHKFGL
jgi:hypothetical protein